jgi:hypothetical protein
MLALPAAFAPGLLTSLDLPVRELGKVKPSESEVAFRNVSKELERE